MAEDSIGSNPIKRAHKRSWVLLDSEKSEREGESKGESVFIAGFENGGGYVAREVRRL